MIILSGILSPISNLLGIIMSLIYDLFHMFGIQNIALSIIVFTFITKTLMLPLNIRQQKHTRISTRMNPEIQKIHAKYKGKTDQQSMARLREEQQAVYRKYGVSQTSGCLPVLISMPILFALIAVINNVPAHVKKVEEPYNAVGTAIIQSEEIVPIDKVSDDIIDIVSAENKGDEEVVEEYQAILKKYKETVETKDIDEIVVRLAKFNETEWKNLLDILESKKDIISNMSEEEYASLNLEIDSDDIAVLDSSVSAVAKNEEQISKINGFLGFSINNAPGWGFPGILIPLLSMSLQFVQTRQISGNKDKDKSASEDPTAGAMSSMNVVMPIMSGFFCLMLPIGVGIYWIATSVYTIIQQFVLNRYLEKVGLDTLIERSAEKAARKNKYLSTTTTNGSSHGNSLKEVATKQTRTIESVESVTEKEEVNNENQKSDYSNPTSISEIANLLKDSKNNKGAK